MKTIPVYHGQHALLGCLPDLKENTLKILKEAHTACGDAVSMRFFVLFCRSFIHPEQVKHIYQNNPSNYTKDSRGYRIVQSILGKGLLTSKGALWRRQRTSAQQELNRLQMSNITDSVAATLEGILEDWDRFESLRINLHMALYAFYCFDKASLGLNLDLMTVKEIIERQAFLSGYLSRRSRTVLYCPSWVPTRENRQYHSVKRELSEIAQSIIEAHRPTYRNDQTLLGRIMRDNASANGTLDDSMIRDEMYAFIAAGNESAGLTMQWLWYTLGCHREYLNNLRDEIDAVVGKSRPAMEHLEKMPLLDAVIKEILRLYPPIFQLARRSIEDDCVDSYHLPKKSLVITCLYLIHRHGDFWERPEEFYPERFIKKDVKKRHPFSYMPFGCGPNQCLGYNIARIEMKCMVIMILQRYWPESVSPSKTEIKTLLTLHAKDPVYVQWKKRI